MALTIPALLLQIRGTPARRVLFGIAVASAVLFLTLSRSLGGMLVASMLFAVVAIHRVARPARKWLLLLPTLAVALGAIAAAAGLVDRILVAVGKDPTLTGRIEIWEATWLLIRERPLLGHSIGVVLAAEAHRAHGFLVQQRAQRLPPAADRSRPDRLRHVRNAARVDVGALALPRTATRAGGPVALLHRRPHARLQPGRSIDRGGELDRLGAVRVGQLRRARTRFAAPAGSRAPLSPAHLARRSRVEGGDLQRVSTLVALACALASLPGTLELLLLSVGRARAPAAPLSLTRRDAPRRNRRSGPRARRGGGDRRVPAKPAGSDRRGRTRLAGRRGGPLLGRDGGHRAGARCSRPRPRCRAARQGLRLCCMRGSSSGRSRSTRSRSSTRTRSSTETSCARSADISTAMRTACRCGVSSATRTLRREPDCSRSECAR